MTSSISASRTSPRSRVHDPEEDHIPQRELELAIRGPGELMDEHRALLAQVAVLVDRLLRLLELVVLAGNGRVGDPRLHRPPRRQLLIRVIRQLRPCELQERTPGATIPPTFAIRIAELVVHHPP